MKAPQVWGLVLAGMCAYSTEGPAPVAPRLVSIKPQEQSNLTSQLVTVQVEPEPRIHVDYGERSARVLERFVLWIGGQQVPLDTYLGQGRFQGTVPKGLDVGRYDIRVTLGDGREATLVDAYEVKPTLGLSFYVETIGPQVTGEPFTVTLHASNDTYAGTVWMTLYQNAIPGTPVRTGPFTEGVRQEQFTLSTPGNYLVAIQDDEGSGANSNSFQVDARN